MEILKKYQNGNYMVTIYKDGTKIRENDLDYFDADFPESIDCKITNNCSLGCVMCHEQSTPNGKHGDIMNEEFINHLHKGTEIAIGGGSVTNHPDLVPFLKKLKEIGVIANITVHQKEYENNKSLIEMLIRENLIYGLGISFSNLNDDFWNDVLKNDNVVVHLIEGIHGGDVFDYLAEKNAKILILGFKMFGRGKILMESKANVLINIQRKWLHDNIKKYMTKYKVISFDNLAIENLEIKNILNKEEWQKFYQGDDGTHTMYVDMVERKFAKTSTSTQRYNLLSNLDDMFKIIKEEGK